MPTLIHRRTLLRGLGGAVVALPALEAMTPARAGEPPTPPKRMIVMYGGMSLIADGHPSQIVPDTVGVGYDCKRALLPLAAGPLPSDPGVGGSGYDIRDDVSIVSGMEIPWDDGNGVPPGGRSAPFHYNTMGPQLSGMRGGADRQERPNGPTADQIVAAAIGGETVHRSLSYRVQAATYTGANSTSGESGRISYRTGRGGELEPVEPIMSPELAYATLFGTFVPPDPAAAEAFARASRRHASVVDLVRHKAEALRGRLGAADRQRFERHLEEVRALEERLAAMPPVGQGGCVQPPDPGADPPVQGAAIEYQGEGGDGAGYSQETLRAELFGDFVRMAFACDQSRVAAIRLTWSQSHMQVGEMLGHAGDIHGHGHGGHVDAYADCLGWHVKHFARLLAMLRDTPEVDGSSLLDHTAAVLLFEGGWGFDPESGNSDRAHSTQNMIALVGGRAGGLNAGGGRHIVHAAGHPAQAVLSVMNAVGVAQDTERLGEVEGRITALFG